MNPERDVQHKKAWEEAKGMLKEIDLFHFDAPESTEMQELVDFELHAAQ